ncbi:MAG: spore coat U domain-containing protein [Hydrogenophilaceae bacterium]
MKRLSAIALAALLLALPEVASAVCILCSCSISNVTNVAFGTYNPLPGAAADTGTGHFRVSCTAGLGLLGSYTVDLSPGGSGTYSPRKMSSGSNTLNYNLYMDAARTTVWGDGTGGTSRVNDSSVLTIGNFVRDYDVYGRILANQQAAWPGSYADTITLTVTLN